MKATNKKSILFFIKGPWPTPEDLAAAEKIGTTKFRNALVGTDEVPEACDGVAGAVPANYAKFPVITTGEPKVEPKPVPTGDVGNPWDKK